MKTEYLIVKEENSSCKTSQAFLNYLKTNDELTISTKEITFKKLRINFTLTSGIINSAPQKGRYFNLTLEKKDGPNKLKELDLFTELGKTLKTTILDSNFNFHVIVLYDSVSEYYSEKAYPLINMLENLMRKLIFKFMFMKIGINWLEDAAPREVKEKILTKADKNKSKNIIQESLYEADFIALSHFIFKPYSTLSNDKFIDKIRKAKSIKDLSFDEMKEVVPKSNWDRYFSKFVEIEKLSLKWDELYELRNKIAHNKLITKLEFERISNLSKEIGEKLTSATNKIEDVKINEQEIKEIKDSVFSEIITGSKEDNVFQYIFQTRAGTKLFSIEKDMKINVGENWIDRIAGI